MAAWASQRPGDLFRVTCLLDVISILRVCVCVCIHAVKVCRIALA